MRALAIDEVRPEMRLGKTLYKGDGRVLLAKGTHLAESYVETLISQGFTALYVEDPNFPEPPAEPVSEKSRLKAAVALKDALADLRSGGGRSINEDWAGKRLLRAAGDAIINELTASKDVLFQVMDLRATDDGYLFAHSVNVCVLGLALARHAEVPHRRLPDLALALLLHDIGVSMIDEELRGPKLVWEGEKDQAYQAHARHGHALLKGMSDTYGALCRTVALQHHEHWDGSGYPQGLSGDRIHPFAQICAVVNTYDRLTTSMAFGHRALPHEALEFLMGSGGTRFPLHLVQGFLKLVAPYPIGTTVRLSDRSAGVVIKVDPNLPARPILRMVSGEGCDLNLAEHTSLAILGTTSSGV